MSGISQADPERAGRRRIRGRAALSPLIIRALGLGLGLALDRVAGDPQRFHPVAGFGRVALTLENVLREEKVSASAQRAAGLAFTGLLVGGTVAGTWGVDRILARSAAGSEGGGTAAGSEGGGSAAGSEGGGSAAGSIVGVAWNAVVVWSCLGGTSLLRVARQQGELLGAGDVDGSRERLPWLCGRDPDALDPEALARAVVESVAENTSDAAVATIFWAAVAGPAGAAAHRATNTLDAMVGHRSPRYQYFGTASARLDDVLGYLPARLAGLVAVVAAGAVGGSPSGALRAWHHDAPAHPSPNAGVVEAVCAGALGVRLGGPTPYPYGVQHRAILGDGRPVHAGDINRAVRLHDRVQLAAAGLAVTGLLITHQMTRPTRRRAAPGWSQAAPGGARLEPGDAALRTRNRTRDRDWPRATGQGRRPHEKSAAP